MTFPDYTVSAIGQICRGILHAPPGEDPVIRDILIDSRRLIHPGHTLFIALTSARNDGHRYIPELYEKGVRVFMVKEIPGGGTEASVNVEYRMSKVECRTAGERNLFPGASFIVVGDTLAALQRLGAFHRSRFNIPVIGITGSNGKTIVKEWLFQLLSSELRIIRSPKSYNSQIGVPLSVWKMTPEHQLAIFEAGISCPGEMEKLEEVIRPGIGIITNIGTAHDEHFESRRQKTTEKLKLFRRSELLVYCADHDLITRCLREDPELASLKTFTWSREHNADLRISAVGKTATGSGIRASFQDEEISIGIPFTDEASVENACHCLALVLALQLRSALSPDLLPVTHPGLPQSQVSSPSLDTGSPGLPHFIFHGFPALTPVAMRLELKEAVNHCSLINDSYNSDINSLSIALDFLNQQNQHRRKTVILSDILQTGRDKNDLYREISDLMVNRKIDRVIGIGRDLVKYQAHFPMQKAFFNTTDEFLEHFHVSSFQNEAVLLKGARLFEFEKIGHLLQQKAHETVMEINLDAMIHNLNHYRSLLEPGTKIMAMVKAFSYGSGSYEIANVLQYHRVDYLAVAYADEGVELRKAGIRLPVMVMSPEEQSLDTLLKYNLEPEIYNFRILDLLEEALNRNQTSDQEQVCIHIKIDTGMHRLGFDLSEMDELVARLKANPGLYVQSVFSHLAASEDPAEDEFTRRQIEVFRKASAEIVRQLDHPVLRHILNSAGIRRFPDARFDMVRLGIGLYGIGGNDEEQSELRNVSTLKSVITQVRRIPAGDTIGYNRKGKADRERMIAVVPVGYADGLNRRLGNGRGCFYVNGKAAPVVGNVCMDLTMVDITGIRNIEYRMTNNEFRTEELAGIREGEEVIIFDDRHPVTELARDLDTIPYEILTGISRRVKRVYFYE